MAFLDDNIALGISEFDSFEIGVNNVDPSKVIEQDILLPWASDTLSSWVYYDCTVEAHLDSGIVVHNQLPQVDNTPDTLAACRIDAPNLDAILGIGADGTRGAVVGGAEPPPSRSTGRGPAGVHLRSNDRYADTIQRMAHSRYWLRLYGQALRIGQQVPIPGIVTIGGVPAIPYDRNPQWAFNRIFPGGSYGGVILWHAAWSLWYTTAVPPHTNAIPAVDAAAHVSVDTRGTPTGRGIQAPYSPADDNSLPQGPARRTKVP